MFASTLPCYRQSVCSISTSSIVFQLLHNLIVQETAGYAISVLCACVTQMSSAITEAVTHLVGLRYFPLTRYGSVLILPNLFVHLCTTNPSDIANVYSTLRWKRLRHPTVSHWLVQWSQTTSSLIYLPSHIRTDSVALCYSACQPLYLVLQVYLDNLSVMYCPVCI